MQIKERNHTDSVYTLSTQKNNQKILQPFKQGIIFMGMYIKGKTIVIRTRPQSFHFAGLRDADNNLNHEITTNL